MNPIANATYTRLRGEPPTYGVTSKMGTPIVMPFDGALTRVVRVSDTLVNLTVSDTLGQEVTFTSVVQPDPSLGKPTYTDANVVPLDPDARWLYLRTGTVIASTTPNTTIMATGPGGYTMDPAVILGKLPSMPVSPPSPNSAPTFRPTPPSNPADTRTARGDRGMRTLLALAFVYALSRDQE